MFLLRVIKKMLNNVSVRKSHKVLTFLLILMSFKDMSRIESSQKLSFRGKKMEKSLFLMLLHWMPKHVLDLLWGNLAP